MRKILAVLTLALLFPLTAWSLDKEPFSAERFEALQAEDALVLIDVYATWCSTCAKQQEILAEYRAENPGVDLHILEVNFDNDKDWVKHFKAPRQSTLLLYRGAEQVWFSVAETDRDTVFAALNGAAVN